MNGLILAVTCLALAGSQAADELDARRTAVRTLVDSGSSLDEINKAVQLRWDAEDAAFAAGADIAEILDAAAESHLAELRAMRTGASAAWGIPTDAERDLAQRALARSERLAANAWTASLSGNDRTTRNNRATAAGIRGLAMLQAIRDNATSDAWVDQLTDARQLLRESREFAGGPRGLYLQAAAIAAAAAGDLDDAEYLLTLARASPEGLDAFTYRLLEKSFAAGGITGAARIKGAETFFSDMLTPAQRVHLVEWVLRAAMESGLPRQEAISHARTILAAAPRAEQRVIVRPIADMVQRLSGETTTSPLDRFGQGLRARRLGDLQTARSAFTAVGDAADPILQPEACFEHAQLELASNRPAAAVDALVKGVAADPSHPSATQASRLAIRIAEREEHAAEATARLLEAMPNHPDRNAWRVALARAAFNEFRLDEALALCREIPTIAPESVDARRMAAKAILDSPRARRRGAQDALEAVESLEEALETHPDPRSELIARILRINALMAAGQRAESARAAEPLLDVEAIPRDLRARAVSAGHAAFTATNRNDDADTLLATYARVDPEGNQDYSRLVIAQGARQVRSLLAQGDTEKAREHARQLLTRTTLPTMASIGNQLKADPWLAVELSLLMRVSGRTQDALVLTESGLNLHPDATEILLEKAEALNALGTPDALAEAMRIFKRLHNGVDRGSPAWWTCELRQLEILERMDTNTSQIGPRIERLRLFNPDLGGPATQRAFDALQARAQRRRLEDAGE